MSSTEELEFITKNPEKIEKFAGKWIAISGNRILAVGVSANEVIRIARKKKRKKFLIFKVPRKDEEMYVLWS
jgi:hypothetical protein